jgi:Leucine Rich repeat
VRHLEYLKLKHCGIGNAGFTAIVGSKYLRKLKVLILSKNLITKLVFPFEDFKMASKLQIKREIMDLQILDLRGNQLPGIKSHKFLSNTVVLAWDNFISERSQEAMLSRTKIVTDGPGESDGFLIVRPNERQRALVEAV